MWRGMEKKLGARSTDAGVLQTLKQHDPGIRVFLADPPGSSLYNMAKG